MITLFIYLLYLLIDFIDLIIEDSFLKKDAQKASENYNRQELKNPYENIKVTKLTDEYKNKQSCD